MRESYAWSIGLGRWAGVQVRLHALFLLFGVFTFYLGTRSADPDLMWYALLALGVLFFSVLAHEIAHCFAARRCDGHADEIVIGPLGGLAQVSVPHEPQCELITAMAGPLMNAVIWLAAIPLLLVLGDSNVLGLLNPLRPQAVVEGPPLLVLLKLTCWLNWILLLVNLLPAVPFDGGRVLRALLWPVFGYRSAILNVARVARVTAFLLCVVAFFTSDMFSDSFISAWVPLVLIAIFLYFSANQEVARLDHQDSGEELFGYDFSQGYTSLERDGEDLAAHEEPGFMRRWLEKRREEKERLRVEQEAAEEHRVDEILAWLGEHSVNELSPEDQALLDRVSARYRNRAKG
jgi:Zn-dependent protease